MLFCPDMTFAGEWGFQYYEVCIDLKKKKKKGKGTSGFEPGTSRSAVECSTTELYPLVAWSWHRFVHVGYNALPQATAMRVCVPTKGDPVPTKRAFCRWGRAELEGRSELQSLCPPLGCPISTDHNFVIVLRCTLDSSIKVDIYIDIYKACHARLYSYYRLKHRECLIALNSHHRGSSFLRPQYLIAGLHIRRQLSSWLRSNAVVITWGC